VIDLLQIPGTWRRPNPQSRYQDHSEFDESPMDVVLYMNGTADWQFRGLDLWSSSGHWKIVKGTHLSIFTVLPDPIAAREYSADFYYHLISVDENQMTLRNPTTDAKDQIWTRVGPGRRI
jgi:hypothetical protein